MELSNVITRENKPLEFSGQFKEILDNSIDVLYKRNLLTRQFEYVSQAFERITGYSQTEALALTEDQILALVHPEDRPSVLLKKMNVKTGITEGTVDYRFLCKDGTYRWLSDRFRLIYDKNGRLIARQGNLREITERKKVEEALRESEGKYRSLFNSIDEGFCIIEMVFDANCKPTDYRILDVNHIYEKQTGLHNVVGKLVSSIVPDLEPHWFTIYGDIALSGEPRRFENESKAMNRYYDVYAFPLGEKKPYRLGVLFKDISESKKAQEALLYNEGLLKGFFDSPGLMRGVVELVGNEDIKHLKDNVVTANYVGLTPKDLENKLSSELGEPIDRIKIWLEHYRKAELSGEPVTWEYADTQGGKQTWLSATVTFLGKASNGNSQFTYAVLDISERKKAEEALKENENLYRTVFDNSQDGFQLIQLVYDKSGKPTDHTFLKVNHAYETIIGVKAEDIIDKSAKYISPNQELHWLEVPDRVAKTGKPERVELYNKDINKTLDCFYFKYSPNVVGTLFRDITERKNLEKQLQEKERLAAIGTTAGMVGHDIRNPLQSIVGDLYFAREELEEMPDSKTKVSMREMLDEVEDSVFYINKIVSELQDYARPIKPEHKDVVVLELVADILRSSKIPQAISTTVDIDQSLILQSDATLLRRILTNLTINAVQAMPNGGKLKISGCPNDKTALIFVEDSGVGIPEEVKPKLFTPMLTTKSKGQGFGLAVAKRLVEALGGTIGFESEEGKGTKFTIKLPIDSKYLFRVRYYPAKNQENMT